MLGGELFLGLVEGGEAVDGAGEGVEEAEELGEVLGAEGGSRSAGEQG